MIFKTKKEAPYEEIHFGIRIKFGFVNYFWVRCLTPRIQGNKRTIYFYLVAISKVLPLGEDRNFMTFEATAVFISDEGKGLFHEATARSVGSVLVEKGVSKNYGGYFYLILKNGDKVFATYSGAESKRGVPMNGKTTIIGGTGKCIGIQGGWDWTYYPLRPAAEGIGQSYFKHTLKYQLP
jgi:hypothetical protein